MYEMLKKTQAQHLHFGYTTVTSSACLHGKLMKKQRNGEQKHVQVIFDNVDFIKYTQNLWHKLIY